MNIDKNNIEEYIFDYLEGNLSGDELTEFKSYVNSNPEANAELNDWKKTYVSSSATVTSAEFSSLKKSNKGYYWATGIAAAFLLGIGTMALIEDDYKKPIEESTNEIVIPLVQEKVDFEEIESIEVIENSPIIEIDNKNVDEITILETEEGELINYEEDNIEQKKQLDIKLEPSTTSRKASLEKVKIKKTTTPIKKKKEVDVIDIETGF